MIKYLSLVFCLSSFRSQFLGFILGISLLYRINLDNQVLLGSCVDVLKKFTISLSELQVDHCFLLWDEYLSVSTQIFFSWSYGGFYHIFQPGQQLPLLAKSPIIPPPDLRLNFLLKETAYQNHKQPAIGLLFQQVRKRGLAYSD